MKYCIVYGSPRKKNTWQAVQIVKERLQELGEVEFTEFFLPRDLPEFCRGCMACFIKGEQNCPHREYVAPIETALVEADGIILASPVYVMEMAAPMKNMLDHFGYIFMAHRPRAEMFSKAAAVISTTAGAGTGYAMAGIARSLTYWGVGRIHKCGITLFSEGLDSIKPKRRARLVRSLQKTAERLHRDASRGITSPLKTRGMFYVMRQAVFHMADNPLDHGYWQARGWDKRERPWKQKKG